MLRFKKPKKKKALRKKEKLDIDALEAEAISAGLGAGDLGSRNDSRRRAIKEEEAKSEAEKRNNAYQAAYAKADEASKLLTLEQTLIVKHEEDENQIFADDEEDLYTSLEKARRLALKKQEEKSGPQAIALLASKATSNQTTDIKTPPLERHKKTSFLCWGGLMEVLEAHKPDSEDVFMDEDEVPGASEQDRKNAEKEVGGWSEVADTNVDEKPASEDKDEIVPDETIHEVAVGKGLSGALKLLKDRGTLKETIEWGGRNMDKKKSKLVGNVDENRQNDRFKDIRIERTDEFDTPSLSVERMREAQAKLKTPYLVLSGHVKPGQTIDPTSGFATVEKDFPGSLTPMIGDRKES
ncbi:SART-1 family protein DOT2 [Hibiscus syriacus]|uniref:SART-1 family protein DOT2 n=1 Tax=Hibiscus syriacus TaxID=106335 RepID=A0A6A2ZKK7_HIBSY|nr:SART-1 family protein DOT2 [Hibiscus syriacus]